MNARGPSSGSASPARARVGLAAAAAFALVTIALVVLPARDGAGPLAALGVIATSAGWAVLWLAAAIGAGAALGRILLAPRDRAALALPLGVAAMLVIDAILGRLGWLGAGGGAGAWAVTIGGILLAIGPARRAISARRAEPAAAPPRDTWSAVAWCGAPAASALLLAACAAPGWLWASEFGGYDALSYHLALPKEWLAGGRIIGLAHNVYSFLPSYVEGAYLHLAILARDERAAIFAAQLLHASLAAGAAFAVAGAARAIVPAARPGAVAALLLLGTPWVIVTGSLAYDEMALLLFLAAGLRLLLPAAQPLRPLGTAAVIGLLAGAAIGAKPTAAGLVAIPLGTLLVWIVRPRRRGAAAGAIAVIVALAVLAPVLAANAIRTGNPVFPFLTSTLGTGHWTAAQAATWDRAHDPDLGAAARAREAWHQLARYGIGPNPDPHEPWRPQWSLLPLLAAAGAALCARRRYAGAAAARLAALLAIQLALWIAVGHVKSRFALPMAVPMALLAALGAESIAARGRARMATRHVLAAALAAWCALPLILLLGEGGGRPAGATGALAEMIGDDRADLLAARPDLAPAERRAIESAAPITYWVNHRISADARILAAGEATPLYYRHSGFTYATTWDRGPLSEALRVAGDDDALFLAELRARGFTHLVVNPVMLAIWAERGWGDPALTAERIVRAAERGARLVAADPAGRRLYELSP